MAATFHLSIVSPDRTVVDTEVLSVSAPGTEGYFGIWGSHVPMMTALTTGIIEYREANGIKSHAAIGGGFLEVSGSNVIILADNADLASEIDIKEVEQRLEEARKALRGEHSSMNADEAKIEIDRAMNRIKAARLQG